MAKGTNTFAQPGRAAGAEAVWPSCYHVHNAAVADGLEPISDYPSYVMGFKTGVALVVDPGSSTRNPDYHWYRLDGDGTWSHKPGQTAATNRDNSGNVITDPRTANRGNYSIFCGFYMLWNDIAEGYGHENRHGPTGRRQNLLCGKGMRHAVSPGPFPSSFSSPDC